MKLHTKHIVKGFAYTFTNNSEIIIVVENHYEGNFDHCKVYDLRRGYGEAIKEKIIYGIRRGTIVSCNEQKYRFIKIG